VLSVRSRSERGFAELRARSQREPDLLRHGSAYVPYAIMDTVVDRYFPVFDALEGELEEIDKADLFRAEQARDHRITVPPEAETDDAKARYRTAFEGDQQALRPPYAAALRRAAGVLSRCLRPSAPGEPVDRQLEGNGHQRDIGEPVASDHPGKRGSPSVWPRMPRWSRCRR
jgi:Mg2+ and Co2+ transporter CorA